MQGPAPAPLLAPESAEHVLAQRLVEVAVEEIGRGEDTTSGMLGGTEAMRRLRLGLLATANPDYSRWVAAAQAATS